MRKRKEEEKLPTDGLMIISNTKHEHTVVITRKKLLDWIRSEYPQIPLDQEATEATESRGAEPFRPSVQVEGCFPRSVYDEGHGPPFGGIRWLEVTWTTNESEEKNDR